MELIPKRKVTENELRTLSLFLNAKYEDAKPLNLTQSHGFLCAVSSAPSMIMPSQYQPILFGGHPVFESMQQATTIMNILMMLQNSIINELDGNGVFKPLLWNDGDSVDYEDAPLSLVEQWCDGYLLGAFLDPVWKNDEEAIALLFPFGVLAGKHNLVGGLDDKGRIIDDDSAHKERYKKDLSQDIKNFYERWKKYRKKLIVERAGNASRYAKPRTTVHAESKIWRNELCPCGSGKKFKKCCGIAGRTIH